MPGPIPESDQLFEIQSSDLAAEEEFASLQTSGRHLIDVISIFEDRWYSLNTISQPGYLFEPICIFGSDVSSSDHTLS